MCRALIFAETPA